MKGESINYETLSRITDAISSSREFDDLGDHVVHTLKDVMGLKGCALMLLDRATNELKMIAACGLSEAYLEKGPINAQRSIAASITEGPVVIFDVEDDPRLQYPEEARKEGIKSIVSLPMVLRGKPLGVLRLYSDTPWEATLHDIAVFQAIALMISLVLDNLRMQKGLHNAIDVLKVMRQSIRPTKRTLYE